MDIKIIKATDEYKDRWDHFVINHPKSNVYQLYNWKKVIDDTYSHKGIYLIATSKDLKILGILPIVKINAHGVIKKFTSIPFFDLGGVLAIDVQVEKALIDHALEIAEKEKIKCVTLRQDGLLNSFNLLENRDYPHTFVKKDKVRLILELGKSSEELFNLFKSKLRSQIRKPIKEGLKVKIGGSELVDDFYKVFSWNMRYLGSPVHSKDIIKNTVKYFADMCKIFTVYKDETPVATSLILGFKDSVYNPWASSLREYSRLSPNMLLYWEMLKFACDKGFKYFDFGRSTIGEGTYKFKKQWGAGHKDLYWYYWSKKEVTPNFENQSVKKAIIKIWSTLPLWSTNILGPRLRKYIDL